jgi:hypothetical protein
MNPDLTLRPEGGPSIDAAGPAAQKVRTPQPSISQTAAKQQARLSKPKPEGETKPKPKGIGQNILAGLAVIGLALAAAAFLASNPVGWAAAVCLGVAGLVLLANFALMKWRGIENAGGKTIIMGMLGFAAFCGGVVAGPVILAKLGMMALGGAKTAAAAAWKWTASTFTSAHMSAAVKSMGSAAKLVYAKTLGAVNWSGGAKAALAGTKGLFSASVWSPVGANLTSASAIGWYEAAGAITAIVVPSLLLSRHIEGKPGFHKGMKKADEKGQYSKPVESNPQAHVYSDVEMLEIEQRKEAERLAAQRRAAA